MKKQMKNYLTTQTKHTHSTTAPHIYKKKVIYVYTDTHTHKKKERKYLISHNFQIHCEYLNFNKEKTKREENLTKTKTILSHFNFDGSV